MERIADKFVVLACCVGALALTGTGADVVGALLASVSCTFAAELLRGRAQLVPVLAFVALSLAVPVAAAFVAPVAYDLAAERCGRWPAVACALLPLVASWRGALVAPAALVALLAVLVAVFLAGRTRRMLEQRAENLRVADGLRERELALEARNRDLMDAQDYEVRLAALSERARIAREIHDNVGHLLTRAVVQAEAQRVVHFGERCERDFATVADTLREALDEVRASVHDLRDDGCDLSVQLRAAAEAACAGSGVEVACRVEATDAPPAVMSCLLAVVREALSNTLRHSDARHVSVELAEHPGIWRLRVADDGTPDAGPGSVLGGSGMGLASMEERVRALGGAFRAGPGERGGWVVFASVPR
ncbi:MAG TPA: sensor histidine kinase [Candidatus Olsenella excrementavium]|uniref:histidine kinase n=1 Tax=Candidatus Olsenella excrementavium TaxID=2838709 RepID=A0A9D2CH94_9ACTN|nr:sensor histidine kinase [Candidatus Olsenella excrementavium]